jgi:hypothetical protein
VTPFTTIYIPTIVSEGFSASIFKKEDKSGCETGGGRRSGAQSEPIGARKGSRLLRNRCTDLPDYTEEKEEERMVEGAT